MTMAVQALVACFAKLTNAKLLSTDGLIFFQSARDSCAEKMGSEGSRLLVGSCKH